MATSSGFGRQRQVVALGIGDEQRLWGDGVGAVGDGFGRAVMGLAAGLRVMGFWVYGA